MPSCAPQKAKLLGYPNFAAYTLFDQMADTPEKVEAFLNRLVPATAAEEKREAKELQSVIDKSGTQFPLKPWDWDHYAEQVRKAQYDLDERPAQALFRARQCSQERRLLCRQPALWPDLQGAQGHPRLAAGCARVRSHSISTARRWA